MEDGEEVMNFSINKVFEDPQPEINERVELFFGRSVDEGECKGDHRYNNYVENYEKEFDWSLYEYMMGHEYI